MKFKRTILAVGVALCGFGTLAGAADGNRYLLVFETTHSMRRDLSAARQCAQDLITGGFAGQAGEGDTIGVWTYDSQLHAGTFPMQVWTEDGQADVAKQLDKFLKDQRCLGDAHFEQVLAGLNRVVNDSETITILIFSDGYDPIQGTPFDASINDVYLQHRAELRDAHIPFVTLLQARDGKIVRGTVNSAVSPIDIPAMPQPAPPPKLVALQAPAPAPVTVVKTNAPLILDYSSSAKTKPVPESFVSTGPVPAATASPAPAAASNDTSAAPGLLAATLSAITNAGNFAPAEPKPTAAQAPAMVAGQAPAVAPAVAVPAGPPATQGGMVLAVSGLILALAGLAVLAVVRRRAAPRSSVITESFKQTKK